MPQGYRASFEQLQAKPSLAGIFEDRWSSHFCARQPFPGQEVFRRQNERSVGRCEDREAPVIPPQHHVDRSTRLHAQLRGFVAAAADEKDILPTEDVPRPDEVGVGSQFEPAVGESGIDTVSQKPRGMGDRFGAPLSPGKVLVQCPSQTLRERK